MKYKVVVYGPEGIGKTTFAAQFPDPVFIDTEGSTARMDVARVEPQSWAELLGIVNDISRGEIDIPCKTIVIDTADWAEKMCAEHVCNKNGWNSLSGDYGGRYRANWEEFGKLLNALSNAVDKGYNVVVTAHAAMRKFEQPDEAGSYDRWELKLQNSPKSNNAAMLKEWGDMVLFVNYKTIVADKDKQGKGKGKGGRRVMYTEHHPCWDAKNRDGLPPEMDFSYEGIRGIVEESSTDAAKTQRKADPEPVAAEAPKPKPVVKKPAKKAEPKPEPVPEQEERKFRIDPEIPEKVRRLMDQYQVDEWDIQNVVGTKGYMPPDMPVRDYPMDFVDGWLVPYFDKVAKAAEEAREKAEIPFN